MITDFGDSVAFYFKQIDPNYSRKPGLHEQQKTDPFFAAVRKR
jgi:hypothetical protein